MAEKEEAMDKDLADEILEEEAENEAEKQLEEEEQQEPEEETAEAEETAKKSYFKKKEKKKDKKDIQIEELTDRLKRTMAEFDNFRKRTEKEKSAMFDMGAKTIVEKILPIVDNFERGLAAVPEENKEEAFVDGMDKVYKQLMKTL